MEKRYYYLVEGYDKDSGKRYFTITSSSIELSDCSLFKHTRISFKLFALIKQTAIFNDVKIEIFAYNQLL